MPFVQLPEETRLYKKQWVTLTPDFSKVVGHGKTPDEALKCAKKSGEAHPFLLYIPDEWPETLVV